MNANEIRELANRLNIFADETTRAADALLMREAADTLDTLNAQIDKEAELRVSAYHDSECRYITWTR